MDNQIEYFTTEIHSGGFRFSGPRVEAPNWTEAEEKVKNLGYIYRNEQGEAITGKLIEPSQPGNTIIS